MLGKRSTDDIWWPRCAATRQRPPFLCVNLGIKHTFIIFSFLYFLDCKMKTGFLSFKSHNFLTSFKDEEDRVRCTGPSLGAQHDLGGHCVPDVCMLGRSCEGCFINVQSPREERKQGEIQSSLVRVG